jgi:hypothetical protein
MQMTTYATAPQTKSGNGKLRARQWIGQNPLPFVFACLFAGLLLGRRTMRRAA